MKRTDLQKELTWDIDSLFGSEQNWTSELENLDKLFEKCFSYKDNFYENEENLTEYYKSSVILDDLITRLHLYAHLRFDVDTTDSTWMKNTNLVLSKFSKYGTEIAQLEEATHKNVDKIIEIVKGSELLSFLEPKFLRIKEESKYKLSEEQESLLITLNDVHSSMSRSFTSLNESDFKVEDVEDSDKKKHKLTHSSFRMLLENKDDLLRENAFNAHYKWYELHKETYATNLNLSFVKAHKIAKLRGFDDALEASLFKDSSSRKVIESLISSVKENIDIESKYFGLYKKLIGKDTLKRWDLNLSPVEFSGEFSIDQQKEIVLKIASVFGEEFASVIQTAFDERWIDWESNDGKRSGAYSSGYQRSKKYILLNNQNNFESISTLAHELGHSVHSYYCSKYNSYEYGTYKIIEAEIASTFLELILVDYLLSTSNNDNEKIFYLVKQISTARGTIIRQTMFAEFELRINDSIKEGKQLSADDFTDIYSDLINQYFKGEIEDNDLWKYEGFSIPHLYNDFYVYKYATGLSSSLALYANMKEDYEKTSKLFIEFLKAGSSDTPLNNIKNAGIDLEDKSTFDNAFKQIGEWVDELERLMNTNDEDNKNV